MNNKFSIIKLHWRRPFLLKAAGVMTVAIAIALVSTVALWAQNTRADHKINSWEPELVRNVTYTSAEDAALPREEVKPPTDILPSTKSKSIKAVPVLNIQNQLHGRNLYVMPDSPVARQSAAWQMSRPSDAAIMTRLASQPTAKWLVEGSQNVKSDVGAYVAAAQASNALPVIVAYNIPQRDCGSYSAGGVHNGAAYREWIKAMASGIGKVPTLVVLEPDALAGMDCLNTVDRMARQRMLSSAVATLKQQSASIVYIDAGNARWHGAAEMAKRLKAVNIAAADGFSLNVSNFITSEESTAYGSDVSSELDGAHFIIDTSRNGAGPTADAQWCNPKDRALGVLPTTSTGQALVDAYLWIKTPGESDGNCDGAPAAGVWWPDYALGLARKAGW